MERTSNIIKFPEVVAAGERERQLRRHRDDESELVHESEIKCPTIENSFPIEFVFRGRRGKYEKNALFNFPTGDE